MWDAYKAISAKEKTKNIPKPKCPFTKKVMLRHPHRAKMMIQTIQCMCSTSSCIMEKSNISSTCPIKCIDCKTGERFHFSGEPHRKCQCHICQCKCMYACSKADIPRIMLASRTPTSSDTDNTDSAINATRFLGNMMSAGFTAALS